MHQAGAFYQYPAEAQVGQDLTVVIDDPDLVIGQGAPAIDDFVYLAVVRLHAHRDTAFGHGQGIDRHDVQAAVQFRKGRGERCFRQSVAGQECIGIEAGFGHCCGKGFERAGAQHLCADTGDTPAAQVKLLQVCAADPAGAEFVTERRRERDGAAVPADQAQPLQGAYGKIPRALVVDRQLGGDGTQDEPDQAHVMVERQPGCAAIAFVYFQPGSRDPLKVAHYRLAGNDYALRSTGAARGKLQVCRFFGSAWFKRVLRRGDIGQLFRCAQPFEVVVVGGSFLEKADELLMRDGYLCLAAGQQALELLNVNRVTAEIERYRHGERHQPDVLAGEEQDDEIRVGIGHQGNVITAFQIEAEQSPGRDPGLLLQFTVW